MRLDSPPFFTIVVPTYNRPRQLAGLLAAVAALDYPETRCEVILVNDGGTVCREELDAVPCRFRWQVVSQRNAGPAAARNAGAARAEGEYLAFTDDDCMPAADWLTSLAHAFEGSSEAGLGGRTVNVLDRNVYSRASQLLLDYVYEHQNPGAGAATFFASNNLAVPRTAFHEIGGFDHRFPRSAGEDRDFCARWVESGRELIYEPGALMRHAHSLSLRTFCRQHYQYGCGAFSFHSARQRRGKGGLKPDSAFYRKLIFYPFHRECLTQACALSTLFVLSQAATVLGYYRERKATERSVP